MKFTYVGLVAFDGVYLGAALQGIRVQDRRESKIQSNKNDNIYIGKPGLDCNDVCQENGMQCTVESMQQLSQQVASQQAFGELLTQESEPEGCDFLSTTEGATPYISPTENMCMYTPENEVPGFLSCSNPPPLTTSTPPPPPSCEAGIPSFAKECNCRQDPRCDQSFFSDKGWWFHGIGVFTVASTKQGVQIQAFHCPWLDYAQDMASISGVAIGFARTVLTYTRTDEGWESAPTWRINGKKFVGTYEDMPAQTFPGGYIMPGGNAYPPSAPEIGPDYCIGDFDNTFQVQVNVEAKRVRSYLANRFGIPRGALYEMNWRVFMNFMSIDENSTVHKTRKSICVDGGNSIEHDAAHPFESIRVPWTDILFSTEEMDRLCKVCFRNIKETQSGKSFMTGNWELGKRGRDSKGCHFKEELEAAFPPDNTPALCAAAGVNYDDALQQCQEFSEQFIDFCVVEICQNIAADDPVAAARRDIEFAKAQIDNNAVGALLQSNASVEPVAMLEHQELAKEEHTAVNTANKSKVESHNLQPGLHYCDVDVGTSDSPEFQKCVSHSENVIKCLPTARQGGQKKYDAFNVTWSGNQVCVTKTNAKQIQKRYDACINKGRYCGWGRHLTLKDCVCGTTTTTTTGAAGGSMGIFDRRVCKCETTSTTTTTSTICEDNFEDLALTQPTDNNLGNMGGPTGACDKGAPGCAGAVGPQEIRYPNVKDDIDFVVTTRSPNYDGWDEKKNGVRGVFGNINVNKQLKVDFTGCFYHHGSYDSVTMPLVPMTFYDLDEERDRKSKEAITVCSGGEAFFPGHTELMMTKEGNCTTVRGCCYGKGKDNPKSYEKLESRHTARTATFTFRDVSCFDFSIETGVTPNDAGRNFLFDFNPTNICKDFDKPMIVPPPCCQPARCKQWASIVKEEWYEECNEEPQFQERPAMGTTTTTTLNWRESTTTTTPFAGPDPREGKVPQCEGCGPRESECYTTCGKKAGACGKCNAVDGTPGACCLAGSEYPKECRGADFKAGGSYFECVLINPAATLTTTVDPVAAAAALAARTSTTPPLPGDYRDGARAMCEGCGPRTDECWATCDKKAGFCKECNSQDGYQGACCKKGAINDPPECAGAFFTQLGYHECVLVNPLKPATTTTTTAPDRSQPYLCAQEGETCECSGSVYYGKKFMDGEPGGGAEVAFKQVHYFDLKIKSNVEGRVRCNAKQMGGDPLFGFYKQCWCVPPEFTTTTTTTPAGMESCPVSIGKSRQNEKCHTVERAVVCASNAGDEGIRAGGGNHADKFNVVVSGDHTVCVQRVDSRAGWGMNLKLNCGCLPTTTTTTTVTTTEPLPAGLEDCPVHIGKSKSNTKCMDFHREVFCPLNAGDKGIRAGGGHHGDDFDATVVDGHRVCVTRTDSSRGWGMDLKLSCECAPTTTTSTPAGLELCPVDVGKSRGNTKCVDYSRSGLFCAQNVADGNKYGDTFIVKVSGREVCVQRTDKPEGWGARLKLECGCLVTTTTTTPFMGTWRCLNRKDAWPGCRDKRRGLSKEECKTESVAGGFQGFGQVKGSDCCLKKFDPQDVPSNLKADGNVEFCYWFTGDDPLPPDYRQGQVPGCSGCGGRADECWDTCGKTRGFCSKCDSAQGSAGACCKEGDRHDPAECKNAEFTHGGYHECVLVNPLQQPPGPPVLIKTDVSCRSKEKWMGYKDSVEDCARAVRSHGGEYCVYGKGRRSRKCYWERTSSGTCPEGWKDHEYDFFAVDARYR